MKKILYINVCLKVLNKATILTILTLSTLYVAVIPLMSVSAGATFAAGRLWIAYDDGGAPGTWIQMEEQFNVFPGVKYWIKVSGVPSFLGSIIQVRVSNEMGWPRLVDVVGSDRHTEPFSWVCPEADSGTIYTVQFRRPDSIYTYDAKGTICKLASLFVIPEYPFGTATSIISMLAALVVFTKIRR
jgi:hypothetical protein